jgi:hypothetical protein
VRLAEQSADLLANWRGSRDHAGLTADLWDDPYLLVSPCNEQDIEPSPPSDFVWHAADYERYADFQLRWLDRLDRLVPNRKALTLTGAFAGGHDPMDGPAPVPDGEYQIGAVREMLHAFDVVGVHSYALMNDPNRLSAPWQRNAMWYMLRAWRVPGHKQNECLHRRYRIHQVEPYQHKPDAEHDEARNPYVRKRFFLPPLRSKCDCIHRAANETTC